MSKQRTKRVYMTQEQKEQILKLHSEGWSTKQIYETVGTSKYATYNFIQKMGLSSNKSVIMTPPVMEEIKKLYLEGLTIKEINANYFPELTEGIINYNLRKLKLTRPNGKQPTFNQDYFEVIDSERKAYWLGFITADGCITERIGVKGTITGKTLNLELKKDDDYLLEELIKDLEASQKVGYYYSEKRNGNFKKPKHNAYVKFGSRKMCEDLAKWEIEPRKSLTSSKLPKIPDELMRHFIRGFFDGDGTVNIQQKWDVLQCGFVGTEEFLTNISSRLTNDINLPEKKPKKAVVGNVYRFSFDAQKDVRAFYHYIYKDATIYLKRKKEIFDSHRIIKDEIESVREL